MSATQRRQAGSFSCGGTTDSTDQEGAGDHHRQVLREDGGVLEAGEAGEEVLEERQAQSGADGQGREGGEDRTLPAGPGGVARFLAVADLLVDADGDHHPQGDGGA
ncbi:hypothetical protein ACFVHQ_22555, partial [Actinomycetes bacterium NPDC127524]